MYQNLRFKDLKYEYLITTLSINRKHFDLRNTAVDGVLVHSLRTSNIAIAYRGDDTYKKNHSGKKQSCENCIKKKPHNKTCQKHTSSHKHH